MWVSRGWWWWWWWWWWWRQRRVVGSVCDSGWEWGCNVCLVRRQHRRRVGGSPRDAAAQQARVACRVPCEAEAEGSPDTGCGVDACDDGCRESE